MGISSVGDMRQHFQNVRNNASLRNDLNTLVQELTTGRASDLTAHLGGGQTRLASVDRQLELLGRLGQSNTETAQLLSAMQLALGSVDAQRGSASSALLSINSASSLTQVNDAAMIARSGFESVIQSLNMRFGDRAMFGGTDLDNSPLGSADDMLDEIKVTLAGLTTLDDIATAVADWFDAPSGGFETHGYLGDPNSYLERSSDLGQTVSVGVRADDAALRDVMKSFALGALAGDATVALNDEDRTDLQQKAGVDLLTAASSLAGIQARLGYAEAQVEDATVRLASQETSLGIARNDLVAVDPFETATKLERVQLQLETHYTLTARLSRLSLTEYLR